METKNINISFESDRIKRINLNEKINIDEFKNSSQEIFLQKIVKKYDLKNKTRENKYVWNRQYFSLFLSKLGYPYTKIAVFLGRYGSNGLPEHSNIVHSIRKANQLIENKDGFFIESIQKIASDLEKLPNCTHEIKTPDSPILILINRIFEARDMEDIESIKAFINNNIKIKQHEI